MADGAEFLKGNLDEEVARKLVADVLAQGSRYAAVLGENGEVADPAAAMAFAVSVAIYCGATKENCENAFQELWNIIDDLRGERMRKHGN